MNFSLRPCVLALALMASSLSSVQAAEEKVTLNFVNSDIESAVKAAGLITGKNFMIDPLLPGLNILDFVCVGAKGLSKGCAGHPLRGAEVKNISANISHLHHR